MNPWLERLRQQKCPGTHATKPTKPDGKGFVGFVAPPEAGLPEPERGFVGFVAPPEGHSQKSEAAAVGAASGEKPTGTYATEATEPAQAGATDLTELTRELFDERAALLEYGAGLTRPAAEAAALELLPDMLAALAPAAAIERWLPVADGVEITNMAARERLALALGFDPLEAGHVADRLLQRDREQTGCTLCCECAHLRGTPSRWRCSSLAGLPGALAGDLVARLAQRCPAFDPAPGWPAPPAAVGAVAAADLDPY